jgi:hypothetical protein
VWLAIQPRRFLCSVMREASHGIYCGATLFEKNTSPPSPRISRTLLVCPKSIRRTEPGVARDESHCTHANALRERVNGIRILYPTGKDLIAAKAEVDHGEWLPMLSEIGISRTWAQKLMLMGNNATLANESYKTLLPRNATALYELSRIPSPVLESEINAGTVNPGISAAGARELRKEHVPERWPRTSSVPGQAIKPRTSLRK